MAQLIYSILALLLIMFLSMNTQRGIMGTAEDQAFNEVTTQMTGVGTEVLERIGRAHFDQYNWLWGIGPTPTTVLAMEQRRQNLCGRLDEDQTSLLATIGSSTCAYYGNCAFIEGFHNLPDTTLNRGDFDFNVGSFQVAYVDPTDFTSPPPGPPGPPPPKSFAKKVTVTVEYPGIYFNNDPTNTLKLTLDRVFTYGCVTDKEFIPKPPPGDRCPSDKGSTLPLCSISP